MLYVLHTARPRNGTAERFYTVGCGRSTIPLPYPVPVKSIKLVRSRPFADLSADPFPSRGYAGAWNTDDRFARIMRVGGTPELPTLPEWKSTLRSSAPSKDWKQRVAAGEIVVNPMMRSTLVLHDDYKLSPSAIVVTNRWAWIHNPIEEPTYIGCLGRELVNRGQFSYPWQYAGSKSLDQVPMASIAECGWYGVNNTADLVPKFGHQMNSRRIAAVHALLIAQLDALPFDPTMVTKTIADTRSGTYDLLTDIAEFKSTVQTLMSCVVRILRAYVDTKRKVASLGRVPKAKKAADQFTTKLNNQWLEFRYGISPMVMSANQAIDWLNTRNHEYAKFRGLKSYQADITAGALRVSFPTVVDRAFGKVRVDGATGGLKLNPLRTALELVPMSLLLNWVCNIGDVLSACYPASSAKQEVYSVSRQVPPAIYSVEYEGEEISMEFSYYRNIVINPYDHIKLQTGFNMNWQRFIDAFAFAYGPLKKALSTKKR